MNNGRSKWRSFSSRFPYKYCVVKIYFKVLNKRKRDVGIKCIRSYVARTVVM